VEAFQFTNCVLWRKRGNASRALSFDDYRRMLLIVTDARAIELRETDLVRRERVNVLDYALLHVLASIYRQPRTALRKIDELIAAKGQDAAFGVLSNNPDEFGELTPYCDDFYLPSPADADVRSFACYALRFRLEAMTLLMPAEE